MVLFYNALDDGWTIKKKGKKTYVFTKKHEGKKEVYLDNYLKRFMKENFEMSKIAMFIERSVFSVKIIT